MAWAIFHTEHNYRESLKSRVSFNTKPSPRPQ